MMLASPLLSAIPGLRHAFFSREGGVSDGIYAGLNGGLGSHDVAANWFQNWFQPDVNVEPTFLS